EIGFVTASFNELALALDESEQQRSRQIRELERSHAEVEALNEELRQQVLQRSRDLERVLTTRSISEDRALDVGEEIARRYQVEGVLGRGGMGTVYAVRRIHDGRHLALKVMRGTAPENVERFAREARIAASLQHPNLISIIDVGYDEGLVFTAM